MTIQSYISLKKYNTFGIEAGAEYFAAFDNVETCKEILSSSFIKNGLLVLGGGSNILFTKDVAGIVLQNTIKGIEIIIDDSDHVIVKVAAGEVWHTLVMWAVQRNYGGLENLSLIPGFVGAAPMQNIGAYGAELKDVFVELEALHIPNCETHIFKKDDCAFGYRDSVFKQRLKGEYIITYVTFKLSKQPQLNTKYGAIEQELEKMDTTQLTVKDISQAVISIRRSKLPDPAEIGNAGSFFKNPVIPNSQFELLRKDFPTVVGYKLDDEHTKVAAGWLIEAAGWKGFRKGDAGVHKNQALVLVNYANATGQEIYNLSTEITESIKAKFGIELEREVNII